MFCLLRDSNHSCSVTTDHQPAVTKLAKGTMSNTLFQIVMCSEPSFCLRAFALKEGKLQKRESQKIEAVWPDIFDHSIALELTSHTFICARTAGGQLLLTEEIVRRQLQLFQDRTRDSLYAEFIRDLNAFLIMPGPPHADQQLFVELLEDPTDIKIAKGSFVVLTMYFFTIQVEK